MWPRLLSPYTDYPHVASDLRCEHLVIGAGVTGLCAALRIAQARPDAAITIVDAGSLAASPSANNAGFVVRVSNPFSSLAQLDSAAYERTNRINAAGIGVLLDRVQGELADAHWREVGVYHAGSQAGVPANDALSQILDHVGVAHQRLDRLAIKERIGTAYYADALFIANGCVLVQPAALHQALLKALPDNVALYVDSNVETISQGHGVIARVNGHKISADNAIIAGNWRGVELVKRAPRTLALTLAGSITKPLTDEHFARIGAPQDWGLLSNQATGATVRLTPDRRIMLRNSVMANARRALTPAQLQREVVRHRQAISARFADIPIEIEHSWSAIEGRTRNATTYFERVGANIYLAGVYNGSGMSRGAALGSALANWLLGEEDSLISDALHYAPATYLPRTNCIVDFAVNQTLRIRKRASRNS